MRKPIDKQVVVHCKDGQTTVTYRIDRDAGIVYVNLTGVLTMTAIAEIRQALLGDHEFDPRYSGLFDLSGMDRMEISLSEIIGAASGPRMQGSAAGRFAIVAGKAKHLALAGLFKKAVNRLSPGRLKVFSSVAPALEWLEN